MTDRCRWAQGNDVLERYHDREWGRPAHDDRTLFEFLILEGAQAGLAWLTILKKRDGYRRAFANFDIEKISRYNARSVERLMNDQRIVRNRRKIESTIGNARAALDVIEGFGSLDAYVWDFVDGRPKVNRWKTMTQIPARTEISDRMSKDLKDRGFRFVGSTICYAFMQAVGLVNDHTVDCFRYRQSA